MRFFQPLLLSAMISAAMPLHAGPLDDPDHPLRPLELQLAELPSNVVSRAGRHLVLHRSRRQLLLIEQGRLLNRYPVAVGMTGWETPAGTFRVLNKVSDPSWAHPQTGEVVTGEDPKNPLGSACWTSKAAQRLASMARPIAGPLAMRSPMAVCVCSMKISATCLTVFAPALR
jgi:hypothetical protein